MVASPQALLLITLLLLCAILTDLTTRPPNPNPLPGKRTSPSQKDSIKHFTRPPWYARIPYYLLWLFHLALIHLLGSLPQSATTTNSTITSNNSNTLLDQICLGPDLLNRSLFTLCPSTLGFIITILIAAPIRLLAYSQLGRNFTFALAKPSSLITTGLYRYVRHPSYTALLCVFVANLFYVARLDGVAACVLPRWVVSVEGLSEAVAMTGMCIFIGGMVLRIRDEEVMMKETFGREWSEYERKTKRLIPWVF